MQVSVFGSNGKVGRLVVALLLERGHRVVAFVHLHNDLPSHERLEVARGDVRNPEDVNAALKGSDAVVSVVSSWKSKRKNVLTAAMEGIIPAMQSQGVSRIVSLTGADALTPGERPAPLNRLSRFLIGLIARDVLIDGERHIELLEKSGMRWTVVRSPVMTGGPAGNYALRDEPVAPYATIPREAVAKCIVEELESSAHEKEAPVIRRV